jgi:hypothetical protein
METELPGTLLGSGRNADVYDIGGGRVLRRYRDGRDAHAVDREAKVMAHARARGVPVPEVFEVTGSDIVMERAVGPTMLDAMARRPWTARGQARLLARLHALVHQVPAPPGLPAPCGDEDLDSQVLVHRDLHPINVILTSTGPGDHRLGGRRPRARHLRRGDDVGDRRFLGGAGDRAQVRGRAGRAVAVHPFVRQRRRPDRPGLARLRRPQPPARPQRAAVGAYPNGTSPPLTAVVAGVGDAGGDGQVWLGRSRYLLSGGAKPNWR